jgi:hypothetical protein
MIEEIKELKELGIYSKLLRKGMLPSKINYHFEMYTQFQVRMIVNCGKKNCKTLSISETSDAFNCCERSVWNAIKTMEE